MGINIIVVFILLFFGWRNLAMHNTRTRSNINEPFTPIYPATVVVVCHSIGFLRNPNTNDNLLLLLFFFFYGYIVSLLGSRYTDSIRTCNINNIPVYNVYVLYYCTRSFVAATSELFVVLVRWLLTDTIASP
ncbi:unnamed protein product [Aphis gossypii]|uniref:Uncharacterized protein n=1 Tax=Aphis gossypii TaxID=80765 RepID=A0A9P0INA8_APHGO|nr:unnamed protein product [Aphis gossypii]